MKTSLAILLTLLFALSAHSSAETRAFIDQSGRSLEGELISISGEFVTIKRANDGQTFTVKASAFSKADQAYFASKGGLPVASVPATVGPATARTTPTTPASSLSSTASTAPMRIDLKVYPNKNEKAKGGFYDDRIQRVSFRVDIRNGEQQRTLSTAKAVMIAVAKDLEDSVQAQLISKEEFAVDLPPLASKSQETKETKITYDNLYFKYGFKYSGYVCVLKDASGKTVAVTGSTPALERGVEELLKLNVGDIYDRNFKFVENRPVRSL
ncbi:MAG: hypothetical protein ACOYMN_06925 [Roseimicrobium sp.]